MRLFLKKSPKNKWGMVIIVFGGFFFLTIAHGTPINKPRANTYNESLTISATGDGGLPAKPEPHKSESTQLEPSKPQGKTYYESLNVVAKAVSQVEDKLTKKIDKTVVIIIYFLLITVALQILALRPPPCSRIIQGSFGIFALLSAVFLFRSDCFLRFISKLFGL
jgi:hypothetical protein